VTVKVGVQLHPQHCTIDAYRDAWLAFDRLGVDSLWTWDHFFPLYGERDGDHFEGWTLLAALGAQTRNAEVGCFVLSMSYRNPALMSQMAKTLDHLCGGRFILGVGAGWFQRDYDEYGYVFGTAGERLRNLERSLAIITERWAVDRPAPVRGTIPIMVGGGGEKVTLRITATYAALWNSFGPVAKWSGKNAILTDWCRRLGRDPAAIERTVGIGAGDLEQLDAYADAGASHLIYGFGAPFDRGPIDRLLTWRDRRNAR
jgi:probable F420-dependent oxidoreductase